ncbi:Vesicle-associated membrane protein-associated protein B [Toxocara canis]|uniref:Major sperm protein n=1 Tax=Toxocara canis TaxID=6265 RepID=A0A0B2VA70_TOXCA|nr:Vesicle-associated membrane protein-associated protein B [Toxocara canis]
MVKTTAPKQYCVRPNSGIIGAGGANSVSIMLQPFDIAQQSIKHKFLIQSAFVPPGETSFEGAWSRIAPSELVNSKLRVVFEEPSSAQHQHEECSKLIQNGAELESRIRTMGANKNTLRVAADENFNDVIKVSKRFAIREFE